MFGAYIYEKASAEYENNVLLIDVDGLEDKTGYGTFFSAHGFSVVRYEDDLRYRAKVESRVKSGREKILLIAGAGQYIPFDVQRYFRTTRIGIAALFPKLNVSAIMEDTDLDFNILSMAYRKNFADFSSYKATKDFIRDVVKTEENVREYTDYLIDELSQQIVCARNYRDWFAIAEKKATIQVLAEQYSITINVEDICSSFVDFVLKEFGKLSTEIDEDTPVLVSRAMDYMIEHSKKFVIIVMDGMSEFDWKILSRSFKEIKYEYSHALAMIPTVTSVSRQCLLSSKFPIELENPWSQSREKKEFTTCAVSRGYSDAQVGYDRGYDAEFGSAVTCAAIIINDVDDLVHGQQQGRAGMYNDMSLLARQEKLVRTVRRMIKAGFDVYISADHGNTLCTGMGKLMKSGVETETKSHRMVVLKDFADKAGIMEKYPSLIEYPKYYLDKQFDYLICGVGDSFDAKGEEVMNHGGITIDEVIVPFIKIKAVDNNG